jgi:hypothetical protein
MQKKLLLGALTIAICIVIHSCVYHDLQQDLDVAYATDSTLRAETFDTRLIYYKEGAQLQPAPESPHGIFRIKYNSLAATVLDSQGKVIAGAVFPEGSLIVKEVFNSDGEIVVDAVLKKSSGDPSAGENWLWAEYYRDGGIPFSIAFKGNGCISCHQQTPNNDLVRVFALH